MSSVPTMLQDRTAAGQALAARLKSLSHKDPAVFALPRGGVPVAAEVARALGAPLDLILVRKIGAPGNPELALGAVAEGGEDEIIINEELCRATRCSPEFLETARTAQVQELARRRAKYLGDRPRIDPAGRTAIVIDDGLATGATMKAALAAIKARGAAELVVALPVAPADTLAALEALCDTVVCLNLPEQFYGVSRFYRDFHQLSDEEVLNILRDPALSPGAAP